MAGVQLGLWVKWERERYRDNRLRALRATRPHTVGYIGGCDQEKGRSNVLNAEGGSRVTLSEEGSFLAGAYVGMYLTLGDEVIFVS